MKIDLGRWRSMQGYGAFARKREGHLFCQFSGGRTSAMMAAMAPDDAVITFQNTGREHKKTLEFVRNVGEALDREVVWLEFRPPEQMGDPPRKFLFERVTFDTAARHGEPIAFREGREPADDGRLEPKRFRLVMLQERRRFRDGPAQFSCACENSIGTEEEEQEADDNDAEEERRGWGPLFSKASMGDP